MTEDTMAPDPSDQVTQDPLGDLPPGARRIRIDGPDTGPDGGAAGEAATTTLVLGHGRDPASARALEVAADLAARLNAHVQVVHGGDLDDYPIDPDAADWEQQAQHALAEQRREVEQALDGSGQGWTYHASRADPVRLIAAVAEEHDALMIIVGTRGEGFGATMERLLGGSISHGVIRAQHRPVLIVPAPEQP
jgi:nucleotide-binding universal stress UspA family protein